MDAIGVKRPTIDPHASAFIDRMVELIADLVDRGMAYETADGVYFEAGRIEDYGLLARQSIESLRAGARVEANEDKHSPIDFALWKKAKPGEPSWPSPWGDGRPGWHTECVVMSLDLLGDGFDIHGGGQDLAFPHHENERAQAVAEGHRFARHWVHNGWVVVEGEKMSKSLGNFTDLLDFVAESRSPVVPLARAPLALPGADRGHEGDRRRRRAGAQAPRLVRPPLRSGRRTGSNPTPTPWRRFRSTWTTTSPRRRRSRCCSTWWRVPTRTTTCPRPPPRSRSARRSGSSCA